MGTVVTVCMILTVATANRFPVVNIQRFMPAWLKRAIAIAAILAGLWNVLWYGLRHLTELWGLMAIGSGTLLVILGALMLMPESRIPKALNSLQPLAVLALLGFTVAYAYTIATL